MFAWYVERNGYKMNSKNIAKSLKSKLDNWCKHIDDKAVITAIQENALITGGALVSLLNGEEPHDYDIYFRTKESCLLIAQYYANKWNESHPELVEILENENTGRITAFIRSSGIAVEEGESAIDDETEPLEYEVEQMVEDNSTEEKPRYRPRYFSANAISLSDKIQLVIRFYGEADEIHKNYDFIHCTCSYDYKANKVNLPARALEAIINKELYYCGSKYPLCSIIRSRKFIQRGWSINAGQYLKMCLQLNEFDLTNMEVFADQITGVDSAYFSKAIEYVKAKQEDDPNLIIDNSYLIEVINRIF